MKLILFTLMLVISFNLKTLAQADFGLTEVKTIQLLKSTREDVKKIFSNFRFEPDNNHKEWYYGKNVEIEVFYSLGFCKDVDHYFDVPEWTAIRIFITPTAEVTPKELGIDLSGFEKEATDVSGVWIYSSEKKGLRVSTFDKNIDLITFFPNRKNKNVACDKDSYPY